MILNKGTYGYRNAHRIRNILILMIIAAVIAAQILAGRLIGGNLRILFTFTGILCVLPLANVASPTIAMAKYGTPPVTDYDKVQEYADRGMILYDLIFTTKDSVFPADFCVIRDGAAVILSPVRPAAKTALKQHLENCLRNEALRVHAGICTDMEEFQRALSVLPPCAEVTEKMQRTAELFLNLSY